MGTAGQRPSSSTRRAPEPGKATDGGELGRAASWPRTVAPARAGSEFRVTSRVRSEAAISGWGQPTRPSRPASTMTSWPLRSSARSCSASGSHSGSRLGACSWERMPGRNHADLLGRGRRVEEQGLARKCLGQGSVALGEGEVDQPAGGLLGAPEVAGEDGRGTGPGRRRPGGRAGASSGSVRAPWW